MRKVTLYIAMSLDGYIAKPGDDLSFLKAVERKGEDYGYRDFIAGVDTVILGRRTYDWLVKHAGKFPHTDKETFVITHTDRKRSENIEFYSGDIQQLITLLKQKKGGTIFIDGGAQLVNALLKDNLIDELIISMIPVLLGSGIKLFNSAYPETRLGFKQVKSFDSGLVQLTYLQQFPGV